MVSFPENFVGQEREEEGSKALHFSALKNVKNRSVWYSR